MKKKKNLLNHYFNYLYLGLKKNFPMLIEEINLKEAKNNILGDITSVHKAKKEIEELFENVIINYINEKYQLVKKNLNFSNRYSEFDYDCALSNRLLQATNFLCQTDGEVVYPQLISELEISDCKKIVQDFYNDLFVDDSLSRILVKDIINNRIDIVYGLSRSYASLEEKKISLCYNTDLRFLIAMTHEVAHMICFYNNIAKRNFDVRLIEVESSFCEKLFLRYLKEKKLKIFDKNGKKSSLSSKDIDEYYKNIYYIVTEKAFRLYEEGNFIYSLNNDTFDRDSYEIYKDITEGSRSFYEYFNEIDGILNAYLPEEYISLSNNKMKELNASIEFYRANDLNTFEVEARYLCSYILSSFFDDISKSKKVVENFKTYLKNSSYYKYSDFLGVLNINSRNVFEIGTSLIEKYNKIINKKGCSLKKDIYFYEDDKKTDLKEYRKIKRLAIKDAYKGEFINDLMKMSILLGKDEFDTDLYPFDIDYQMDDNEVEEFEALKNKVLKLYDEKIALKE